MLAAPIATRHARLAADQTMTVTAPSSAACSKPIGPGCSGTNGVPTLAPRGASIPAIGSSYTVDVGNLDPAGAPALLAAALNPSTPALELTWLGLPGCHLYVGNVATSFFTVANTSGAGSWTLVVPSVSALQGHDVYLQAVAFDPGLPNAFGAVLSNGLRASVY